VAEAKKATWASGLVAFTLTVVVIVLGVLVITVANRDDEGCTVHLPTDLYGTAAAPAGTTPHATSSTSSGGVYPGALAWRHARSHKRGPRFMRARHSSMPHGHAAERLAAERIQPPRHSPIPLPTDVSALTGLAPGTRRPKTVGHAVVTVRHRFTGLSASSGADVGTGRFPPFRLRRAVHGGGGKDGRAGVDVPQAIPHVRHLV
jgi:hypothetical protein